MCNNIRLKKKSKTGLEIFSGSATMVRKKSLVPDVRWKL